MITHIVFIKLNDRNPESAQKIQKALLTMQGQVPQLRHLEVGLDILHSARSYDMALVTKFDSLADLQDYQNHPVHVKVKEQLAAVAAALVVVDYESN
ncbi:MAG: Dabb family protein [Desulfotomaculum sp.]|nr:Dabb family protein [Desulfotomaculum sp.]MCL0081108.1 Dabb family protein [Peptococcaceae bacterium]